MTYSQLFDSTPHIDGTQVMASRYADGQFHNLAPS